MGEVIMRKINEEEILGFRKVFKIPSGVAIPDQIKAKYIEEESVLKICIPKFVKQICGFQIEEVKGEEKEEEFGESSHKVIKEFKVVHVIENPNDRLLEIRNRYRETEDNEKEENGKEETGEEVKSSEVEQNVGGESQELISNRNIVIQSSEESDNGAIGMEEEDQIIGGRKEKEIKDTTEETVEADINKEDRIEGRKLKELEEPKYEIEDRDVEVKEGTEESVHEMKTTSNTIVESEEEFENIKGGSNEIQEIGKGGFEEAILETKVKDLLIEYPNNRILEIGNIKYGGHEIEVEVVDEREQREGIYEEISEEIIDNELMEDIRVEGREGDIIKAKDQRDEVYMEISQEEERRERQFNENQEKKKLHGPLFVAGPALVVVSLVFFFIRRTRVEKK